MDWLKCDAKVFWIAGKPASGKSTLVNYVANHYKTRELMEEALGQDPIIAKFFFDFRAKDGIENNFEGLRRSLLYQILTTSRTLAAQVWEHFGIKRLDDQIILASAGIFEFVLQKNNQLLLFFIEGLDEYQGDKPELLDFIDRITRFNVKVCLSSRYEKPFTITFRYLTLKFRMDILNEPDIRAHAVRTFEAVLKPPDERQREMLARAAGTIAKVSAGVFLWARFAISQVLNQVYRGHAIEDNWLQGMIAAISPDLEEVYARIIQSMEAKDRTTCGTILRLISSAERTLGLPELFQAALLASQDVESFDNTIAGQDLTGFQQYLEAVLSQLL